MPNENTPDDNVTPIDQAKEGAKQIADAARASIPESVDPEKIGKHARNLRDRAELFIYDHKIEVGAVVVFTAGFWMGRRVLARGFLQHLADRKREYLELAVDEKQVKKLIKNKDNLSLLFDTPDGMFALRAIEAAE